MGITKCVSDVDWRVLAFEVDYSQNSKSENEVESCKAIPAKSLQVMSGYYHNVQVEMGRTKVQVWLFFSSFDN